MAGVFSSGVRLGEPAFLTGGIPLTDYVPTVRMRRIARTLLKWREIRDLKGADVAARAGWSASKQSRLENATQPIQPAEVVTLGLIYGIPVEERDAVFNSCLGAQKQGWWDDVAKDALMEDVVGYVELEAEATGVRAFMIDLIPGLFQTSDYAAAIGDAYLPRASGEIKRERVKARIKRQERLTGESPIQVEAVLTEGALRTRIGGPKVMRQQLDRLAELSKLPNVDLRVIPAAGAYPAMGTPFCILSFVSGYPDIGYIELLDKGVYLEESGDVEPYRNNFAGLQAVAWSERKSRTLIANIARDLH
jgi:transcriptional regulator with XRE-family HTH domain